MVAVRSPFKSDRQERRAAGQGEGGRRRGGPCRVTHEIRQNASPLWRGPLINGEADDLAAFQPFENVFCRPFVRQNFETASLSRLHPDTVHPFLVEGCFQWRGEMRQRACLKDDPGKAAAGGALCFARFSARWQRLTELKRPLLGGAVTIPAHTLTGPPRDV